MGRDFVFLESLSLKRAIFTVEVGKIARNMAFGGRFLPGLIGGKWIFVGVILDNTIIIN